MPQPKVRLLKLVIQPTYVVDDGEHLREVPVQPIQVDSRGWDDFKEKGLGEVEDQVRQQLADAS
jgi:hypothetical protein